MANWVKVLIVLIFAVGVLCFLPMISVAAMAVFAGLLELAGFLLSNLAGIILILVIIGLLKLIMKK